MGIGGGPHKAISERGDFAPLTIHGDILSQRINAIGRRVLWGHVLFLADAVVSKEAKFDIDHGVDFRAEAEAKAFALVLVFGVCQPGTECGGCPGYMARARE